MGEWYMEKSAVEANLQLIDNYISEFSLNVYEKINKDRDLDVNGNIGFRIVNISDDLIGQIELKYDIDISDTKNKDKKLAKIILNMNGLFKESENIDKKEYENMLKINGAVTLSHLSRAYINTATALSGMPTITLPLINFHELFKNAEQKNEEEQIKDN